MNILITDRIHNSPKKDTLVLYWNFNKTKSNSVSIPTYLEENSKIIRGLFLDYIHCVGHKKIDNLSLISKLQISKNFSFWWLNLISEKSPFKSKNILNALKILCVIKIIKEKKPEKINIKLTNKYVKKDLIENFKQNSFNYSSSNNSYIDFNIFFT